MPYRRDATCLPVGKVHRVLTNHKKHKIKHETHHLFNVSNMLENPR